MPVVFDTSFLIPLLDERAPVPRSVREALRKLEEDIQKRHDRIVVPAPALAEFLTKVADASVYVERLNRSRHFQIAAFGMREAVDLAARQAEADAAGDKRSGIEAPWNKVKFDRQIVSIAVLARASVIYSNDGDIRTYAAPTTIPVVSLRDLPLPEQGEMFDDE